MGRVYTKEEATFHGRKTKRETDHKVMLEWLACVDEKWVRVAGESYWKALTMLKKILRRQGHHVPESIHLKRADDWQDEFQLRKVV